MATPQASGGGKGREDSCCGFAKKKKTAVRRNLACVLVPSPQQQRAMPISRPARRCGVVPAPWERSPRVQKDGWPLSSRSGGATCPGGCNPSPTVSRYIVFVFRGQQLFVKLWVSPERVSWRQDGLPQDPGAQHPHGDIPRLPPGRYYLVSPCQHLPGCFPPHERLADTRRARTASPPSWPATTPA